MNPKRLQHDSLQTAPSRGTHGQKAIACDIVFKRTGWNAAFTIDNSYPCNNTTFYTPAYARPTTTYLHHNQWCEGRHCHSERFRTLHPRQHLFAAERVAKPQARVPH